MFLRQFQYLVTLAEEKNFGRAAQRCNVSQPSLSSAIKQLEQQLGIPIVIRNQRFSGLTEEGKRVLEWGKRILADRDALMMELALMHRNLEGRIRIGAMPMSSPVLPMIDRLFFVRYPGVQIETQFIGLDKMIDGLNNSYFDVGVTYLDENPLGRLETLPLYDEQFALLIPNRGWAESRTSMTWAEAAERHPRGRSPAGPGRPRHSSLAAGSSPGRWLHTSVDPAAQRRSAESSDSAPPGNG